MPLRCQSPEGPEFAFLKDEPSWQALKEANRTRRHLRMPCCHGPVVLKRSSLGTFFFAHHRTGACESAPESREHLLAKEITARAALAVGWNAATESRDPAQPPAWIADVLCSRPQLPGKVAFEIQWTRQTHAETAERQAAYARAGIRALWLMRQRDLPISNVTPAFRLVFTPDTQPAFEVWCPGPGYSPQRVGIPRIGDEEFGQRIELDRFVRGALTGALKFDPLPGLRTGVSICLSATTCFSCQRDIRIVSAITVKADEVCPGIGDFSFSLAELEEGHPEAGDWVQEHLPPDRLKPYGVGSIQQRYSRTVGGRYLSNGCLHCGALQGRFYEHEAFDLAPVTVSASIKLTASLLDSCHEAASARRWWFDVSQL